MKSLYFILQKKHNGRFGQPNNKEASQNDTNLATFVHSPGLPTS